MNFFDALESLQPALGIFLNGLGALLLFIGGVFIKIIRNGIKARDEADKKRDEKLKEIDEILIDIQHKTICTPDLHKETADRVTLNSHNISVLQRDMKDLQKSSNAKFEKLLDTISSVNKRIDDNHKELITHILQIGGQRRYERPTD